MTDEDARLTLCIPSGDQVIEIDFDTMQSLQGWLLAGWEDYQDQLYQLTGEITATNECWVESPDEGYILALVSYDQDGTLQVN